MNVETLKGVGEKTSKILQNNNIYSINDLLNFYPFRYNFINFTSLNETIETSGYIEVKIVDETKVAYIRRNFNKLSFRAIQNDICFNVIIYNRAFLKNNLKINQMVILYGKYDKLKNNFLASDIKFNLTNHQIEPVYHTINGIKPSSLIKIIDNALLKEQIIDDYIPDIYNEKYHFISKKIALKYIHQPKDVKEIKEARIKLIYEELFKFMFKVNSLKEINTSLVGIKREVDLAKLECFVNHLPFKLTDDQIKATDEIKEDMLSSKRMNRLLLGDVGSGKTIVATYAILINYLSHHQCAFMAPTEILAKQHYDSLRGLFKDYSLKIELLTGKNTKKEKNEIIKKLNNHEIDLIIGTHALLSENVSFANLGLVITDEQHRFGVKQRNVLEEKGNNPDVLYLSATPIPRTYALIIYGDTDVSIIKTKPIGRKEILTKVVKEDDIKVVLSKMYDEIKNGHQIFVVSPLIEDNENDLNSVIKLKDNFDKAFNNKAIVEIIHGKMKQKEKDLIMNKFQNKEIDILISTTVIEVGIDVPNATIMAIYNAERFGLATLHQLRGRIGRNNLDSYCYLISNYDNKRLKIMEESNDGFYITEKDFENRKEGDLFGTKQSGDMEFLIANLKRDYEILLKCNEDCKEYLHNNGYLKDKKYLKIINDLQFLN